MAETERVQLADVGPVEVGLVLISPALKSFAFDRGAELILAPAGLPDQPTDPAARLPREILDAIRNRRFSDLLSRIIYFRVGAHEYSCRAYLLEPQNSFFSQSIVALHLQRNSLAHDALSEITARYHLTAREEEVLRGISSGLGTKDLANRLNISPNTVKAFLRLIMVKLGVATRAELFAKVLDSRRDGQERPPRDSALRQPSEGLP